MSEIKADLMGVLEGASRIARDVADMRTLADHALREINSPLNPPAPLTEDAIVAALKADPVMAAEVLVTLGFEGTQDWRARVADRASYCCQYASPQTLRSGLQSLAVALAAASYRG